MEPSVILFVYLITTILSFFIIALLECNTNIEIICNEADFLLTVILWPLIIPYKFIYLFSKFLIQLKKTIRRITICQCGCFIF
ncbi:MAG: hypothetical protein BWY36_00918 [Candidatus Diapherotrites archaeon ADurb.Bin253]|nr:MAG: hypothetical protein BWY36_00918 [Candidatus Diapherotrites archaeon ADurb.Bin253]